MVLLWGTDKKTILRSLEIDIRGALEVHPLDSAGDTEAAASHPPAGSSVGVTDGGASSSPARKITAYNAIHGRVQDEQAQSTERRGPAESSLEAASQLPAGGRARDCR
jgi:hypothetical protein